MADPCAQGSGRVKCSAAFATFPQPFSASQLVNNSYHVLTTSMLKPLAVQSLLDGLTSSSSGLPVDTTIVPRVALLALAESGQLFAASSRRRSSSSKPSSLSHPHSRFESLMCPVAVQDVDSGRSDVFDDQKIRALSALAARAWSEWKHPKRDRRTGRSKRSARHEASATSARSGYDGSASGLTLISEVSHPFTLPSIYSSHPLMSSPFFGLTDTLQEYGIIHIQPLLATRLQPAVSPPVSLTSSPRAATLDEEEKQFSAPDDRDATLLLILNAEAPSVNGNVDVGIQALRAIANSVAKALGPNLALLDS